MSREIDEHADLIEHLERTAAECREAIKEAHRTARDLKAQTDEAREALSSTPVEAVISALVVQEIEKIQQLARQHGVGSQP